MKLKIIPVVMLILMFSASNLFAQDMEKLLKRLDKVEKQLVYTQTKLGEMKAAHKQEIASLKKEVSQTSPIDGTSFKELTAALVAKVSSLERELSEFRNQQATLDNGDLTASLVDQVTTLETELAELRHELSHGEDSHNPQYADVSGAIGHMPGAEENGHDEHMEESEAAGLEISGFFDFISDYAEARAQNAEFGLGEVEVDFASEVSNILSFEVAIAYRDNDGAFEVGAALADIHLYESNGRHIRPAFSIDHTGVVVGQFDVPFGIDLLEYASIDSKFISSPIAIHATHDEWNDFGVQLYADFGVANVVTYWVNGFEASAEIVDTALALSLGVPVGEEINTTPNDAFGGRLGITPISNIEIGTSFALGTNLSHETEMTLWGADMQLNYAHAHVTGEYIVHQVNKSIDKEENKGFYVQGVYGFGNSFLTARYGGVNYEGHDAWEERVSLGAGYGLGNGAEVRAEYQINDESHTDGVAFQLAVGF